MDGFTPFAWPQHVALPWETLILGAVVWLGLLVGLAVVDAVLCATAVPSDETTSRVRRAVGRRRWRRRACRPAVEGRFA